ncbi:Tfp pilus assembly protein PilF [Andreprevotia lacus DSM 23236]|jgi:tetratricopeptide (TPR) repeat protein|uniref:Tfp pilus assembly protein PilF n=1 Tax=Andreprevotia lacus DSM 23236 TaxID=1121001 RepID=A0A1W1XUS7_9NEIS|nr:tetratricopeptide repeat protein [Andreprevotia lacus]SMC27656.1 Tfp pilus assembly protein PilF [Andreprevotia lacus DSM 23236]
MTEQSDTLSRYLGFLRQDPDNIGLLLQVVAQYRAARQPQEAEALLDAALSKWPGHPTLLHERALLAMASGDAATAKALFHHLQESGADSPVLRYNTAYAHYLLGEFADSAAELQQIAPSAYAEVPRAPCLHVLALHHQGELAAARELAEGLLATLPEDADLAGALALTCLDDSDIERASHWAQRSLAIAPAQIYALTTLGTLELATQPAIAGQHFDRVLAHNPHDGRAWSGLALSYLAREQLDQAAAAFSQAVKFMPGHIGTWHAYGWLHLLQQRIDDAARCFQAAFELDHNFGESHGALAIIATLRGNTAEADALIKRAQRLAPDGMSVRFVALLQAQAGNDPTRAAAIVQDAFGALGNGQPQLQALMQGALARFAAKRDQ